MNVPELELDAIVRTVLASKKYGSVCPETVRRIATVEWARLGTVKATLKETKRRLHQIYSAYERKIDYQAAYWQLEAAYGLGSAPAVEAACRQTLHRHRSTAERLPILGEFYDGLWSVTGVPRRLLDLGCGLNPLTIPWMRLPPGAQYFASDIDVPRVAFLNRYFALAGVPGLAACRDVICHPPETQADVALLLKTSPTLERQGKGSTLRLLQALNTPFVVVSFSVKSLGGWEKGMVAHYEREFLSTVEIQSWLVRKLVFDTELAFVVRK